VRIQGEREADTSDEGGENSSEPQRSNQTPAEGPDKETSTYVGEERDAGARDPDSVGQFTVRSKRTDLIKDLQFRQRANRRNSLLISARIRAWGI